MFLCIAGIIGNKAFTDILLDLVTLNLGTNNLPSSWMHLTQLDVSFCCVWDLNGFNARLPWWVSTSEVTSTYTVCGISQKSTKSKWEKEVGSKPCCWWLTFKHFRHWETQLNYDHFANTLTRNSGGFWEDLVFIISFWTPRKLNGSSTLPW